MTAGEIAAWSSERLFHHGDEYFLALLEEIGQARQTIDFESYIFEFDPLGDRVLAALTSAAARGVRVRLIVDGIGAPAFNAALVRQLNLDGIHTRVYHPLPWALPLPPSRSGFQVKFRGILNRFFLLNRRDHRKLCIIDGKSAWLGSMNVDAHHLQEFCGTRAWSDLGVRVTGPSLVGLEQAFVYAWRRASGLRISNRRRLRSLIRPLQRFSWTYTSAVRLNTTGRKRRHHYHEIINRISLSRESAWLATPYFAPEFRLLRALHRAARSGADVRILIPRRSDLFFMPWVTEAFYARLLLGGVRIFEYLPAFLHEKAMILDEWILVGSSNLNHRSLLHDLELDVVLDSPISKDSMKQRFIRDFEHSSEIKIHSWKRRPLYQRITGRILLFFRYWF